MKLIAFDTETGGLDWFNPDQRAFLLSWATNGEKGYAARVGLAGDDDVMLAQFRRDLAKADTVVCHNLPFDLHQLRETLGIDLLASGKTLLDTNVLAQVVVPERRFAATEEDEDAGGYKLKSLSKTYVRPDAKDAEAAIKALAKAAKIKLKDTGGYFDTWRAYPKEMEEYARLDASDTYALYAKLAAKLEKRHERIWKLECEVAPVLIAAERKGVRVDQAKVVPLQLEYAIQRDRTHEELVEVLGEEALTNPDKMAEALVAHGVPLYRLTEKAKKLATHKFALAEFKDQFPIIEVLEDWRQASKFLSTYIDPMLGRETVHTSFRQLGAWTGRMSCSRPNMQNIPARAGKEVREVFIPREGMCFVVCDYESIEVMLLAHYLNDDGYKQMIRDGLDPHAWMASQIWGGEIADYEKGTPGEEQRTIAKNVLFAICYGAGGPRVADMLDCTIQEARALIRTIKTSLPRYMKLTKDRVEPAVKTRGFVNTIMGRRQTVKRDKAYIGLNALIQGSAADIFKQGAINAAKALEKYGAYPVLFVHDELVIECPIDKAERVGEVTSAAMCAAFDLDPPLSVETTICLNNYAEGK